MSSHYFTNDDNLSEKSYNFTYSYNNHLISFTSGAGVFSKKYVDFGTRTLLEYIAVNNHIKTVLDVGCGIGVIGISLAKAYPSLNVDMIDVNNKAIDISNTNILQNNLHNVVCYESDLFTNVEKGFDMILSNPPIRAGKAIVHQIVTDGFNYLNDDGEMWIVINKKHGAPSMVQKMIEVFGSCVIVKKNKGYWVLMSKKTPIHLLDNLTLL